MLICSFLSVLYSPVILVQKHNNTITQNRVTELKLFLVWSLTAKVCCPLIQSLIWGTDVMTYLDSSYVSIFFLHQNNMGDFPSQHQGCYPDWPPWLSQQQECHPEWPPWLINVG